MLGGVVTGWYQSLQIQMLGLDGIDVIVMNACQLLMSLLYMNCSGYGFLGCS